MSEAVARSYDASDDPNDDVLRAAAELAFVLLRFESSSAHPFRGAVAPGRPRLGIESWQFVPSWNEVLNDRVVPFLVGLSSPALVTPSTTRGLVALTLLDELQDERAAWGAHTFENQRTGCDEIVAQLKLPETAQIVLQCDDLELRFGVPVLRAYCARFAVQVGWMLRAETSDPHAQARMMLYRSDGGMSWGGSCPFPRDPSSLSA